MELEYEKVIKYWGNENPVCPWCDAVYNINDNEDWNLYEEGFHDIECPSCEKEFRCESAVKYTFNTDEQSDT